MKIVYLIGWLVGLLVGMQATVAAEVPDVDDGFVTTAGGVPTVIRGGRNAAPASGLAASSPAWVRVTPVLLPSEASPSWAGAARRIVDDAVANTSSTLLWQGWTGSVTNPATQYTLPPFRGLEWWMLAESTTAPMWRGELNPSAPFGAEKGQVLWHLIDARSVGGVSIALADITLSQQSEADGNTLGDTISMVSTDYSPLAVGIMPDGKPARTSGVATNKVQRVVFLAKGKRFNGGGTATGLSQIRGWVTARLSYAVRMTASVGGRMSTATSYLNPPALPEVTLGLIRPTNGPTLIRLNGGKVGQTYRIQSTGVSPVAGPWIDVGNTEAGEDIIPDLSHAQGFYRAVPQ